jgi:hypothetical protein
MSRSVDDWIRRAPFEFMASGAATDGCRGHCRARASALMPWETFGDGEGRHSSPMKRHAPAPLLGHSDVVSTQEAAIQFKMVNVA